jgi:hypothetical protein
MTDQPVHCFEKSNLGKAPFRCVAVHSIPSPSLAEHNPTAYNNALAALPRGLGLGSCHYCGMAIMHNYEIVSADHKHFVVGSECVNRTGDVGLIKQVRRERLKMAQEKRAAKSRMKREEREAAWKVERDERAAAFKVEHADLIAKAATYADLGGFIADVIKRGLEGGRVSDRALEAVANTMADLDERARLRAASQHVGTAGERRTFKVRVQRVSYYVRPSFSGYGSETVWIVTMREGDNAIVSKSTAFCPEKGQELTIKATIKAHDSYQGEAQTLVQRVKVC